MKKVMILLVTMCSMSFAFAQDAGWGKGARDRAWGTAERAVIAVMKATIDDDRVKVEIAESSQGEIARTEKATTVSLDVAIHWDEDDTTHVTYVVEVDKAGLVTQMKSVGVKYE